MTAKLIRITLAVMLLTVFVSAEELSVAAASDLQFALRDIAARFEKATGNTVRVSYGSSGNFFTLIQNGAPYDVFFSADIDYPRKLEAAGKAEPGTVQLYATGKLVVWVRSQSPLDLKQGLNVLLDPRIRKIAIANPIHAPYGRAAVAALRSAGLYDRLKDKFVTGENISQTAQFVETGNADAGLVALSLALSPTMASKGRYVEVPQADYPMLEQGATIVKSSTKKALAKQFLDFLKKPESVAIMQQYGFLPPR